MSAARLMVHLGPEVIDPAALLAAVADPAAGAVDLFLGIVRDHADGRQVTRIDYSAYEPMARRLLADLAEQVAARFPVAAVAITHRLGTLAVGEASVAIATSSAHRAAAFEATRWAIDRLKTTVPIWKLEHFSDGTSASDEARWVSGTFAPDLPV